MRLAWSSLYNLAGIAAPLLIMLAVIPLLVRELGAERYGALAIVWIVLGYFGAADFGIGRAVSQRIASRVGKDAAWRAHVAWSGLAMIAMLGLLTGAIAFLATHLYFAEEFKSSAGLAQEMVAAAWLIAPCVLVATISGVPTGVLSGMERWGTLALGTIVGQAGMQLAPLAVALLTDETMSDIVLAVLGGRALGLVVLLYGMWRAALRRHRPTFLGQEMAALFGFGKWIMVGAVVGPLMVISDRFLIGAILGAAAVAAYAIPFQIAYRTLALPMALSQALFPRLAAASDEASLREGRDTTLFIGQVFTPVVIVLILAAGPLLEAWLGAELDRRSVAVAQIVLAGAWFNAVAQVPSGLIQARGNSRFTGLLALVQLPLYLGLLVGLGAKFGLAGFAAAFALRCALDCGILLHKADFGWSAIFKRLGPTLVLVLAALALSTSLTGETAELAASAFLLGSTAIIAAWLAMPEAIKARLASPGLARR